MTRILIVDDNPMIRRGLRDLIERNDDWEVCGEASDGRDAVRRAEELKPDLVLLDLVMPLMNGLEAARQLNKSGAPVQILLCTLHLSPVLVNEARRIGIQGTVSKSEVDQIKSGISALLRKENFYAVN
jgi:DNA-binding NarL/FixJ family response regulator